MSVKCIIWIGIVELWSIMWLIWVTSICVILMGFALDVHLMWTQLIIIVALRGCPLMDSLLLPRCKSESRLIILLGNRGMTVEAARKIEKSGGPWHICNWMSSRPFLLGTVFFRTSLPYSGAYHLERGGINCKKAQLLKIKAQVSSIWAKGSILMIVCVCVCVIWLDMITPPWWREEVMGILLLILYQINNLPILFLLHTSI